MAELPPGHQGAPSAAAPSHVDNDATVKTTEPVVPIYKEEEVDPTPKQTMAQGYEIKTEAAEEFEQESKEEE